VAGWIHSEVNFSKKGKGVKKFIAVLSLAAVFCGCSTQSKNGLKVAATAVPHAQMLEFVKPELKEQGIDLKIIVTDDYNMPNRALANKEVDANFFQHTPFLDEQIKEFHYPIESIGKIEIEPIGVYSKKIKSLAMIPNNAVIAVPNDPTNEGRALLLLEKQGLIQLKNADKLGSTILDIQKNPKNIQFLEVDAAMLARALDDVTAAVINTNYVLQAGLNPLKDALVLEDSNSPYANILVIKIGDENRSDIQALKKAMSSEKMKEFILKTYKGAVIPAF
jgi:D-methionine transport system substrate-binding protein